MSMRRVRTAVLISGYGSNLQALIDAAKQPNYPAEIVHVISNKADAYGLKRAEDAQIPTSAISHRDYADRTSFDEALHKALVAAEVELVCLAGFMRLLTAEFTQHWTGKMINIHPSLLPDYKGLNTHARVIADGRHVTGCTVHHVIAEMDAGEIIIQKEVPVLEDDTPESLAERVHQAEHQAYPEALAQVAHSILTGN